MTAIQVPLIAPNVKPRVPALPRVLVVDDDALLRAVLRDALYEAGYDVAEASDGYEALQVIDDEDVDLVLLDGRLPHLSGREVVQRLRSKNRTRTLPIIMVTAADSVPDRVAGLAAGADDYVTKPFAIEEIVARVRTTLRAHGAWRRTITAHERHRAALSRALADAATHRTLADACVVLCDAIAGQDGVLGAALVRVTGGGRAASLANAGNLVGYTPGVGLLDRAGVGPWVEPRPLRVFAPLEPLGDGRPAGVLVVELDGRLVEASAGLTMAIDGAAALSGLLLPRLRQERDAEAEGVELRALLDAHAFRPHFQPIVDLRSGVVVGAEALTRFDDGSSPEARFGEASAIGLGVELELATLASAVTAAQGLLPDIAWLSLNVSPELMLSSERDAVRDILDLRDRDVVLELSECQLVTDYDAVRGALRYAGDGIRWSIDDAGSGFASLRHILRLEPAFIKLDRSWVEDVDTDPAKRAMIAGLCHFATQTGAEIIAEGIETEGERRVLGALGVGLGQGYLLGRPAPATVGSV
ncbi:MAG TPA: EAL domain-containing protein [Acidimicrobiales bacterium]|nr:EAL domain-containing protein [Acidimicrobiales bacterium]